MTVHRKLPYFSYHCRHNLCCYCHNLFFLLLLFLLLLLLLLQLLPLLSKLVLLLLVSQFYWYHNYSYYYIILLLLQLLLQLHYHYDCYCYLTAVIAMVNLLTAAGWDGGVVRDSFTLTDIEIHYCDIDFFRINWYSDIERVKPIVNVWYYLQSLALWDDFNVQCRKDTSILHTSYERDFQCLSWRLETRSNVDVHWKFPGLLSPFMNKIS